MTLDLSFCGACIFGILVCGALLTSVIHALPKFLLILINLISFKGPSSRCVFFYFVIFVISMWKIYFSQNISKYSKLRKGKCPAEAKCHNTFLLSFTKFINLIYLFIYEKEIYLFSEFEMVDDNCHDSFIFLEFRRF